MSSAGEKRQIGPFQLEKKLGVGGMGIVYLGTYVKNGAKVAVKVLAPDLSGDPKVAARFDREMEILKKLKDPHIVKYYGGSSTRTQRYYAMELITGGSLDKLLRQEGKIPWETVVEYGIQIAKALEHAHREGVIHRDLKPANLLLTEKGTLKLSDFGIARDTQATALTAAGKTVGTMAYMAPEQITGKKPVTARTDLYSLGCVLFELLTGRTPFASATQPEMLFKHIDEVPPKVREFAPNCPIWLEDLIDDLLQKEPEDRPFDALDVQVKLEQVKQKVTEAEQKRFTQGASALTAVDGAGATKLAGKLKKKRKKKKVDRGPIWERAWFLGAILAAIVGVTVWVLWPDSEQEILDRVEPLMASNDSGDWYDAESDLERLLARFPNGEHADDARKWLAQIEMDRAEKEADLNIRLEIEPETEAERLFVEAREYERFGDRMLAREKYQAMVRLLGENADEKSRPYINLAQRQIDRINASLGSETDRLAFIREKLERADELYRSGNTMEATQHWEDIIKLYGELGEFEQQVSQARARLDDPRTVPEIAETQ